MLDPSSRQTKQPIILRNSPKRLGPSRGKFLELRFQTSIFCSVGGLSDNRPQSHFALKGNLQLVGMIKNITCGPTCSIVCRHLQLVAKRNCLSFTARKHGNGSDTKIFEGNLDIDNRSHIVAGIPM